MEICKACKRPLTEEMIADKRARKVENARASARKAKANGSHIGRLKIRDDEQIKELRRKGLTMREIAKEIGLNHQDTWSIYSEGKISRTESIKEAFRNALLSIEFVKNI